MTLCKCRLVTSLVLIANGPLGAQLPSRFDAGAGAGGSVVGWQPRLALSAEARAASFGPMQLSVHGSLDRFATPSRSLYGFVAGAKFSTTGAGAGWWLGGEAVRRDGLRDVIEEPRIESGGWRRIGSVLVSVSAVRRSAAVSGTSYFSRSVTSYYSYLDSTTGHWDSTRVVRTVRDSARRSEMQRWAETHAAIAWQGPLVSAGLTLGGRLPSRGIPSGAWASADVGVRLAAPLSLVVGAGGATGGRFVVDAEHRYVTLGLRITPQLPNPVPAARPLPRAGALSAFAIEGVGGGQYRLMLRAPHARRVEISGDFTAWKAVPLTSSEEGQWTLVVQLTPGSHRLNARVDGGAWIVPPGLTTINDDFAGEVGVLVIERAGSAEDSTK